MNMNAAESLGIEESLILQVNEQAVLVKKKKHPAQITGCVTSAWLKHQVQSFLRPKLREKVCAEKFWIIAPLSAHIEGPFFYEHWSPK